MPWLGYFYKIANSDIFVILDTVQYVKGTVANRNKIKGINGEEILLSVPVKLSEGAYQHYNEIAIDYSHQMGQ
ncbi:MAG: WbqC family protein [Bacteroidetes bacterium]|nr:WbqC family protein [Bacteroidota bacterium]